MTAIDAALEALRAAAAGGLTSAPLEPVAQRDERRRALAERLAPPGERTLDADAASLDDLDGAFDLIHVRALHEQLHPHAFLERLAELLSPTGALLVGSAQLPAVQHSELARFVPGDTATWWVPGRLCLRWLVEAVGFVVVAESETIEIDRGLVYRYLRAELP